MTRAPNTHEAGPRRFHNPCRVVGCRNKRTGTDGLCPPHRSKARKGARART